MDSKTCVFLWIWFVCMTFVKGDSESNVDTVTSLFDLTKGKQPQRGCPPPIKEFDHQGRKRYEG